ncbi:MAG TPA: alkaline phosphatase family protein [Hyphomicrobiaceae bacterium]|nr:alkaline phosphatase family protein [Hyphomicrobiaceae bacterium]
MTRKNNVLFIMCDQLRFDYLGCYGHPVLKTPHIDRLAERGVRFTRAYVQSPICGPSRMSTYTGRYMRSHGSHWNGWPLRVGEPTLGDHLKAIGVRNVLVGKTHMTADREGLERLGLDPTSIIGVHVSECGFEPYERDDGLHPDGRPRPAYDAYLRAHGFNGNNPWQQWANSGQDADGSIRNGWLLANADKAARVDEEHSETPYMTGRAMDFIREARGDPRPWCLHLSYIKPHWPYIAPEPYASMYKKAPIPLPIRSQAERDNAHPVFRAFMDTRVSQNFSAQGVRETVIPAYMGLIKQIDDQLGRLFKFLDEEGLAASTMIVFTSDHGDYLGDHWMGEKDLFHEVSVKVPLIVYDPSPRADASRGVVSDVLVEAIDLAPTFLEFFGAKPPAHRLEGRSLLPILHGQAPEAWRDYAFSEYDYAMQEPRVTLHQPLRDCRLFMVVDRRYKLMHAVGFRPMLFDLETDPDELVDLGTHPDYADVRARLTDALVHWSLTGHNAVTTSEEQITDYAEQHKQLKNGVIIGYWDEAELEAERARLAIPRP